MKTTVPAECDSAPKFGVPQGLATGCKKVQKKGGLMTLTSNKKLLGAPGIATSNKGLTTRSKKQLVTRIL